MNTPYPFATMRREVTAVVEAAQKAEREGNRQLGRSTYERAIRMLTRDEGAFAPALIRRIARSYIDDGIIDAALDCLAAAQHLSRARGDTSGVAHALNQMAVANLQRGDVDSAEALYHKTQALAEAANDAPLEAMVAQNLGIIAGMRGNLDAALGYYGQSLAGYRALGLTEYLGPVINNMAMAYSSLGRWSDAQRSFEEALAHNLEVGDAPERRQIQLNLAGMWLSNGEVDRAAE
jgi:tetratricopeptide (TPR) repeat protein